MGVCQMVDWCDGPLATDFGGALRRPAHSVREGREVVCRGDRGHAVEVGATAADTGEAE